MQYEIRGGVQKRAATLILSLALVAGFQLATPAPMFAASSVSTITALSTTTGRLYNADDDATATWATATTEYTLRITRASVTLIPTVASGATWTCDVDSVSNDDCFATGLAVGDTSVFEITVTAQDEIHTTTYTITAVRYSTDATLSNLTIDAGTLSPAFDTDRTSYTASTDASTITLTQIGRAHV